MTRFMMLCAVLFSFALAPVALAAPEEDTVEAKADVKADTKVEAKDDAKADEKSPVETKTEDPPDEPSAEEAAKTVEDVVAAARSGEWALMISGIIMLVLAGVRKFKLMDKIPNNALPWISVVLGVLAVVGESFASGGEITMQRLLEGVMAGLAASGAWALIGKHLPLLGVAKES